MSLALSAINIPPGRQRREFDEGKHQELVNSIREKGLFHPLVVSVGEDGRNWLIAGERRFRAIKELADLGHCVMYGQHPVPLGFVPAIAFKHLSQLERKEIELEENLRRVDLTWQETVKAEAELMELRNKQASLRDEPALKPIDFAEELRGKRTPGAAFSVSQALLLAKNLHRPEVAGAKSMTDAFKVLKREELADRNYALASGMAKDHLAAGHRLLRGNCLTVMQALSADYFDVICSDPPYGVGADNFGNSGGKTGGTLGSHPYSDNPEDWHALMAEVSTHLNRLAKQNAHLYLFCDFDRFHELAKILEDSWRVFRTPLIWHKANGFRAPWPDQGPQRKYETILYAVRGTLPTTFPAGDVLDFLPDFNIGHPAQKPVALIQNLLRRSCSPGMKVLDPFCGSGTVFKASQALSCFATGIEIDETAAGIAANRLESLV